MSRTLSFYSVAFPALFEYKMLEFKCEKLPALVRGTPLAKWAPEMSCDEENAAFEPLHAKWAPRFRSKFLELRGFYLKHGQAVANNVADLFPRRWQEEMEPLLDQVPPESIDTVRAIVESEGLSSVSLLEGDPLGSASIGQVHRGTWNGRNVVVKVQYPQVERTFRGDVFAVKRMCKELFPQYYVAFEEIERQFETEFDYRGEAKNCEEIRNNLERLFPNIVVPRVHLATKRALVMDEVEGVPLTAALRALAESEARRRGVSLDELVVIEKKEAEDAARRGKVLKNPWWVRWFWRRTSHNNSLSLSPAALVDRLLQVHGHQVLVDGVFNGDPHPGNCLVHNDGTVALVDYGQVKRIDDATRLNVARLLLLVDEAIRHDPRNVDAKRGSRQEDELRFERAKQTVASAMLDMGFKTERGDTEVLYQMASVYFGRDDKAWLYPLNFQQWTDQMQTRDPVATLDECEPMVFVVRCAMLLRGLGHCLHEPRNLAQSWKPIATTVLKGHGKLKATLDDIEYIRHGTVSS